MLVSGEQSKPLMWSKKGFQVFWKDLRDPESENLNFSSFIQQKISRIHISCDGVITCFHLRRIARLAKTVVKAMTWRYEMVKSCLEEMPKRTVKGLRSKSMLRALLSVSNTLDQKSVSRGQLQNIWRWLAGDCLQRWQASLISGIFFASLAFVKWAL